eukprot:6357577-Pyramimonas_sp.AAC.1
MGTNTKTGGCLHRRKMILDFGVGGHIPVTLEARMLPPSPRLGSSSLGEGTPPILVLVSTSGPATAA